MSQFSPTCLACLINIAFFTNRHVKRLLDQISKTLLVEEKKTAIVELVFAVWSSTGQMAFGETG